MFLVIIAIVIYLSVFSLVYQIYLDRRMRISLGTITKDTSKDAVSKENILRKLIKPFAFLAGFKPIRYLTGRSISAKLVMAGSPVNLAEFAIMKILSMIISAVLAGVVSGEDKLIIYTVTGLVIGFIIPDLWLSMKVKRRHREIRRDLPPALDLLNLCVDAGLDFMLAVNRVIKDFKKCPLTDELSEVWRENKMGLSRREALQHLSRRVNLPELSSFVRTLLQADRMGAPMSEALKIQAEEIRQSRYFQGEEAALKAPIKLLFPLFCFILPVVLVIVAGPILIQFLRGGSIKF